MKDALIPVSYTHLGYVGSTLLRELMRKQEHIDITTRHNDCGLMLYRDVYKRQKDSKHADIPAHDKTGGRRSRVTQ